MASVPDDSGPAEDPISPRTIADIRKGLGADKEGRSVDIATPEVAVLALALNSSEAADLVATTLSYQDFASSTAQRLYHVIRNAISKGKKLNPTTVAALLEQGHLQDTLMVIFRDKVLAFEVNPDVPVTQYIADLKEWTRNWRIRLAIEENYDMMTTFDQTVEQTKKRLERTFTALDAEMQADRVFDDQDRQLLDYYDHLLNEQRRGLTWGFRPIDRVIQPILPGNFVQIGGPSGSGKSTITRNLVLHWINSGRRVAALTSEMGFTEQAYHYGSLLTGIDLTRIYKNELSMDERHQLMRMMHRIKPYLRINDKAHITPEFVLNAFRRYVHEGYNVLVLDHFHRVDFSGGKSDDTRQRIGQLASRLKSLAQDHNVIVLALVQLTKMADTDEPNNENIRESNQIVEEADKIVFTWRKQVWGTYGPSGAFEPTLRAGATIFEEEDAPYPGRSALGRDDGRVYLKPGKQRVGPEDALIVIPFAKHSGRMRADDDVQGCAPAPEHREHPDALAGQDPEVGQVQGVTHEPPDRQALPPHP